MTHLHITVRKDHIMMYDRDPFSILEKEIQNQTFKNLSDFELLENEKYSILFLLIFSALAVHVQTPSWKNLLFNGDAHERHENAMAKVGNNQ